MEKHKIINLNGLENEIKELEIYLNKRKLTLHEMRVLVDEMKFRINKQISSMLDQKHLKPFMSGIMEKINRLKEGEDA